MAVASLFEDLLDQYKIEQHIAEKRYTDLYQAYDVDDDRLVRLDIVRSGFAEDSSFAGRFVNRARALAQVRHPNIAQVLHIGKATGGAPYVAQAEVDGYPLSHRLEQLAQRNSPANPIYALKIVRQLTDALLLAERLEIFHYDLQPENVLLKNVTLPTDDAVVLIDLFIPTDRQTRAAAAPRADAAPQTDLLEYLSPEQRAGKEVTAASHVYSLGAMLYRLLAGNMPPGSVTVRDSALGRLLGRSTSLERERGDLSFATYQLVDRSLRKDPRGRYPTIEAFAAALDSALAAEEVQLGTTARTMAPDRRPWAWLLPLLIVALLVAVGAVATRGLRAGNGSGITPAPQATINSEVAGGVAAATATATATTESVPPTRGAGESIATASEADLPVSTETADSTVQDATPTSPASPSSTATEEPTAPPTVSPTAEPPFVRVMFNVVNLRRGPGVAYPLVGSVVGGESLEVLARSDDEETPWYLVLTDDQRVGWIAASVVQPETPDALVEVPVAATLPPTPIPTSTPTPTPTVAVVVTILPTTDPGDLGEGGTEPPDRPTDEPTEPPDEPTLTPPPFTPSP